MKRFLSLILTTVAFLAFWQIIADSFLIPNYILPSPWVIFATITRNIPFLAANSLITLGEVLFGFALGFALAVGVTLWSEYSHYLNDNFHPLLATLQIVPKLALAPLLLLWIGYGLTPKIIIAASMCLFPIALNFKKGLNSVDQHLLDTASSIGSTRAQILRHIQIPFALPALFTGLKIGINLAITGAIVGEYVGASQGLGYQIIYANAFLNTPMVFAVIFVLIALGGILNYLIVLLEKKVVFWEKVNFFR